ncbi:unnamed protein product [Lactuca saligna]|uniref:Uncharacterized protein n=1 Tax=Lactuca saligna TaxID=75948 RepID=A0AA35ZMP5_LACSI|nr:unnamed protein product [Lactuca saligna]
MVLLARQIWNYKTTPSFAEEIHNLHGLINAIGKFQPTFGTDTWKCPKSNDGIYNIDTIRLIIDNTEPTNNEVFIPWIHDVPIKVEYSNNGYLSGTKEEISSKLPFYPGLEAVGLIALVGDEVKNLKVGTPAAIL